MRFLMLDSCMEGKDEGLPRHDSGEGAESPEEMRRELESLNQEIRDSIPSQSPKLRKKENRLQ